MNRNKRTAFKTTLFYVSRNTFSTINKKYYKV